MDFSDKLTSRAMQRLITYHYHKILYVDITDDTYSVLTVDKSEWSQKASEIPSQKISEWFSWFADSPLCHDDDRNRFREFTDLMHLKAAFRENDGAPIHITYRRKFREEDDRFSQVIMELIPEVSDEGHLVAFLLVRDITAEVETYKQDVAELELQNAFRRQDVRGRRTLLLIEDNRKNLEILNDLLDSDYNTILAENGLQGLEILQERYQEISLVLLDVQMPVMDGYEFLKKVKSNPLLAGIPVIVATSSKNADEEERCLKLGASDFVSKPYNANVVISRIGSIIKLRESAATLSAVEYDDLTGLYTRQAFHHHMEALLRRNPNTRYRLTISDIQGFKLFNERFGEQACNEILLHIAGVLKKRAGTDVLVGRYDRDQFACMVDMDSPKAGMLMADTYAEIESGMPISNLVAKVGVYDDLDHNLPAAVLCDRAIMALQTVKHQYGKFFAQYDTELQKTMERQQRIEMTMKDALLQEQFTVYYQPKHDAKTGKLIGAEALIRWNHPEYGFMPPNLFIPLFEKNGFIVETDRFVWRKTCKNLRKWIDSGLAVVPISVNSSRLDFEQPDFLEWVKDPVKEYDISPDKLHIEVTESLFSDHIEEMTEILRLCREDGFQIELDDFGTGYSSLNTLGQLPLDYVKLDMSFVRQLNNARKARVLAACINLTKSLGMQTIAEGVETEAQLSALRDLGTDAVQGYHYSKPLTEIQFEQYLRQRSAVS